MELNSRLVVEAVSICGSLRWYSGHMERKIVTDCRKFGVIRVNEMRGVEI